MGTARGIVEGRYTPCPALTSIPPKAGERMTETTPGYYDLSIEDTWIDYLRTRLPYSFNRIEAKGNGPSRHFMLFEPVMMSGSLAAERHNFWQRGNVYYMSGKVLDYFSLSEVGRTYRMAEAIRLLQGARVARPIWPVNEIVFYNSMQLEKVWGFAQHNHLDRERVMMTNVILAVELCLKAIMTHAAFWDIGCFRFSAGHEVVKLYEALPEPLRDEMAAESEVFAREYVAFRTEVGAEIERIRSGTLLSAAI